MKNKWGRLGFCGLGLWLVVSCSTGIKPMRPDGDVLTTGEMYYSDGNRAPAAMSPPVGEGGLSVVDPVYLRTQADYHFTLAESLSLEGDVARAIEEYKLTLIYDPKSPAVHLKLGAEYVKKGLLNEAIKHTEEAVSLNSKFSDAHFLLGGLYSSLKLFAKARAEYQAVTSYDPENTEAHLYLGALLAEEGEFESAVKTFEKSALFKENPSPYLSYYYVGKIRLEMKDRDKARVAFEKALTLKPEFPEGVMALGSLMETAGLRAQALKLYSSYQDKFGSNDRIAESLAKLYLEDEEFDKAYKQYEVVSFKDPHNLNSRVKMALILIEQKNYERATIQLKEILSLAPDSDKIRFYLGAVYEEVKNYSSAIEQFSHIPVVSMFYEEAVIHSSYLYKITNDYSNAIATVETAIRSRADIPQFYALYASLLDDRREYRRAVDMLGQALDRFPKNDQLWFFLGAMQDKVGERKGTVESMKKVLEINGEHIQALNYLAYVYAELSTNLDEAKRLALKALELKPGDAYIQDTYGWVLFKLGKYDESVRVLEGAFRMKSQESVIAEHLGDAYYRSRLPVKARAMYEAAKGMEKDEGNIRKLQSKIEALDRAETADSRLPASTRNH